MNGRLSDRATAGDLVLVQPQAKPQAENFLYFSHRQLSLGQSAPSTLQWRRLSPAVVQRRLAYMKFSSENHSGDVNIDSGPGGFLHPFQPGIHIHIASESIFTSLRNDYSHAPESAFGMRTKARVAFLRLPALVRSPSLNAWPRAENVRF